MLWISPLGLDLPPDPTELQRTCVEVVAEADQQMASHISIVDLDPPPEFHALKQQSYVALRTQVRGSVPWS